MDEINQKGENAIFSTEVNQEWFVIISKMCNFQHFK